ncbi:MAG: hypothetical protein ABJM11_19765 [Marinobacter sp.]|uniref:hypothetical protein n=1 Tax=Marinobacter sp. TaxID=50741 RepID=UPI00329696A2
MSYRFSVGNGGSLASSLNLFRRVTNSLKLSATLHKIRQLFHFAPWRSAPIYAIQKLRPPLDSLDKSRESVLGDIDAELIAEEIRQDSVAILGQLPADFVSRLRKITDQLPPEEYQLVHQVNDDVRHLTQDPGIKKVLRAYLKSEPVLLEASLFVSRSGQSPREHKQNSFHFDYAGWASLNLFVYLTDVDEESSYHIVAKGSHRDIKIADVLKGSISLAEADTRFGGAIKNITGPAGTVFFENTEAFHRRHFGSGRRVMLNLLFSSHRSLLSRGRASRKKIARRDREFQKLDAL